MRTFRNRCAALAAAAAFSLLSVGFPTAPALAADHGDAPALANDQGCDIADIYFFLNPSDNTKVCFLFTVRGFIVPGEAVNFGVFDHLIRYRYNIENTGDVKVDKTIDVTFSPKTGSGATPQTATVRFGDITFTAPSTPATLDATAPDPVITTGPNGIRFFAGVVDDPFFFDIPGFSRFTDSLRAGARNEAFLQRGRDTFAGFNILCIALEIPRDLLVVNGDLNIPNGLGCYIECDRRTQTLTSTGVPRASGPFKVVDRMGVPGVNVVLLPFLRKNQYNNGTPRDDSRGRFANEIINTARVFGTNNDNVQDLATVAVFHGDFLRLNLNQPNTGPGGGNNEGAKFPNGRRIQDDVVDIVTTTINNDVPLGDNVNGNDKTFRNEFPFVAPAHQPRDPGVVDDSSRN